MLRKIQIAGYANTNILDRAGDIVPGSAWINGLDNYSLNPILLYQHQVEHPIGIVDRLFVLPNGLFVEATVLETGFSCENIFPLIENRILRAFSVGFSVKDKTFDRSQSGTIITQAELLELSIVAVGANQQSLFKIDYPDNRQNRVFHNALHIVQTETL